jgi:hypothetical protein
LRILLAGHINFFVENKERPQANVKDFLFMESDLRWGIPQLYIRCRSDGSCCGCTAGHRHRQADGSRNRYGLLEVLLLCLWHIRNLSRSTIYQTPCAGPLARSSLRTPPKHPHCSRMGASDIVTGKVSTIHNAFLRN